MKLLKNRQIIDDTWTTLSLEETIIPGDIIIPFERWKSEQTSLTSHEGKLGVLISSDTNIDEVIQAMDNFALVALNFPKYTDGTCFSYGFLLRERHNFAGELRAVGDVFQDQFSYLERCGFDAIQLEDEAALEAGKQSFEEISVTYQSSADKAEPFYRVR